MTIGLCFQSNFKGKPAKKFKLNNFRDFLEVSDMDDFNKKVEDDEWNEALYSF